MKGVKLQMILTKGQEEAIKTCVQRFKSKLPYTTITGPAGSGKSSVVPYIVKALGIHDDEVVFATLTGKASLVLREKGCENAMTLHKLLYIPKKIKDTDDVEFIARDYLENNPKLIVVDEASMVSKDIFDLLLSHKVHIIFLGDNFQLPAIGDNANILDNPHVVLTEITRQALDSPIIRLSMDIRAGKPLTYGGPKEARIIPRSKVSDKLLLGADIILCGRNTTRRQLNTELRKLKWGDQFQEGPINGDKLICLKNCWQITDQEDEVPLINGSIGTISRIHTQETKLLKPKLTARFADELGNVFDKTKFNIDYKLLTTGEPTVNSGNFRDFYKVQRPVEFDYGYCITCHKAQGSQWDKVLVFAEQMGDKEYFYKWLYTSCTRAVEKCVIVI